MDKMDDGDMMVTGQAKCPSVLAVVELRLDFPNQCKYIQYLSFSSEIDTLTLAGRSFFGAPRALRSPYCHCQSTHSTVKGRTSLREGTAESGPKRRALDARMQGTAVARGLVQG
ncbi:hypothetical protein HRR86_009090 [Exophiala dermatitidis]|nr:hypothetical protein HRR86_009090 [Exophiala dermatitidis]